MKPLVRRPLVGITCWREEASFGVWKGQMDFIEWAYLDALTAAGAVAVAIPPAPWIEPGLLARLDALVIAGGGDVEPGRYGRAAEPATAGVRAERDEVELTLARAALERDLPLLGICRGHQVLAVAGGGTLVQDLPAAVRATHAPVGVTFGEHEVSFGEGSTLGRALGPRVVVKTHHHQAVEELGEGWVATGWAPDGTVEAIERPAARFAVGVQWHPEWSGDPRVFEALIEHAVADRAEAARR